MNRAVISGRLTDEVIVKKTQSGLSVASYSIAVNEKSKDDKKTYFINCVSWRQGADYLGQYAHKGDLIGVDGRITTRSYDKQDGTKVYVTEVVTDRVEILSSKQQSHDEEYKDVTSDYASKSFEQKHESPSIEINSDDLPF